MGDTITQCPNCETSFRVGQELLEVADGRVRCGQCKHVFSALEHVVETAHAAAPTSPPAAASEPEPEPEPKQEQESESEPVPVRPAATFSVFPPDAESDEDPWHGIGEEPVEAVQAELEQDAVEPDTSSAAANEFSDFVVDDVDAVDFEPDDTDHDGATPEPEKTELGELEDDDLLFDDLGPRREQDVVAEELLRREALQNSEFDESFFDSLNDTELAEDDETRLALPPLRPPSASAEADPDADTVMWDAAASPAQHRPRDQDSDTRWALEMIDDLHRDRKDPATAIRSVNEDFGFDDATQLDSFNVSGAIDRQFDNLGGFGDGESDDGYPSDFDRARRGGWLWATGSLLLVLLLAAQYLVFNFETLATDERFRPALQRVCASLACELPVLEDLSKITSEKLVVRSHPDKSAALMVDVIITNRAKFAQPFPALELTFSDLRGTVVATQSFYPSEYLHGELSGMTLMPSRNPIRLELDIDDPGSSAINYKLTLVKGYD